MNYPGRAYFVREREINETQLTQVGALLQAQLHEFFHDGLERLSLAARDAVPLLAVARVHVVDGCEVNVLAVPAKRRKHHAQIEPRFVDAVDRVGYAANGRSGPCRNIVEVPTARAVILRRSKRRVRVAQRRVRR